MLRQGEVAAVHAALALRQIREPSHLLPIPSRAASARGPACCRPPAAAPLPPRGARTSFLRDGGVAPPLRKSSQLNPKLSK
jgi:hypothetical protein